jgi:hypothetical protein
MPVDLALPKRRSTCAGPALLPGQVKMFLCIDVLKDLRTPLPSLSFPSLPPFFSLDNTAYNSHVAGPCSYDSKTFCVHLYTVYFGPTTPQSLEAYSERLRAESISHTYSVT